MTNACPLSNNTSDYVEKFQCTLKEMMDQMSSAAAAESISAGFIRQMISHHRAAIAMAGNLLRFTTNIALQNFALNIISSQEKSIENMSAICGRCQSFVNYPREAYFYKRGNDPIVSNMFHEMQSACTDNNIDTNFLREMIPHHKGAVLMSEHALRFRLCPELVRLLDGIIQSQKEGLRQLQQMLSQSEC